MIVQTLFHMTFHVINVLDKEQNAKYGLTNAFSAETLQEIGFHIIILMTSTFLSTIWDKSSASYGRVEFHVW